MLARLAEASAAISSTRSRNAKRRTLAELLSPAEPTEGGLVVSYLSGSLPQGKIGVGYALLSRMRSVAPAASASLTVSEVDRAVERIAAHAGPGSATRRQADLEALFAAATGPEQEFLLGLLGGGLRQGALEGVMVEALADASEASADQVRRAVMVSGDLVAVARRLIAEGPAVLGDFRMEVLTPVQPMLAQTADSVDTALERLGTASFEVKLDGARIQVHRTGRSVRAFTRSLKDVTAGMPEVVATARALDVRSVVLDGEVIALRPDGTPHPFQETMGSFSSTDDDAAGNEKPTLSVFFFDCLHLDGEDLIDRPYRERIEMLDRTVPAGHRIDRVTTGDAATAARFMETALADGHEGLMAKSLDDPYEAGRRGATWLKIKYAHTLDLVVLGVEWGSGRRTGWLSNLHLGARDPQTGEFVMLGKTFKGLTDEMLQWQTERFLELETRRRGHVVYVRPEQVVEVAFDGVQSSSRYPGGVALRFARVKRYRTDKTADQVDTIDTIRAIHRRELTAYR